MRTIFIDPDYTASGYAVFEERAYKIGGIADFFDLQDIIKANSDAMVFVEVGEQNRAIYNAKGYCGSIASKIAASVGKNFAIAKQLVLFCQKNNISVVQLKPIGKRSKVAIRKKLGAIEIVNQDHADALYHGIRVLGL